MTDVFRGGHSADGGVPILDGQAAMNSFTHAQAAKVGPRRINVNAVAPGWIRTDMNAKVRENAEMVKAIAGDAALGRFGETSNIAVVVAFLVSEEGSWITTQVIDASSGYKV